MIYKDAYADADTHRRPAERDDEECLHCGKTWDTHDGWACEDWYDGVTYFDEVPAECRYLTESMKDSIAPKRPKRSVKQILTDTLGPSPTQAVVHGPDLSDWRTWAHKEPGDCPCGIKRAMCDYHR